MRERVVHVDGVEVIDASDRRSHRNSTPRAARSDEREARLPQLLTVLLYLLVASLRLIIVTALWIGHVLGAALRLALEALPDTGPGTTAGKSGRESNWT